MKYSSGICNGHVPCDSSATGMGDLVSTFILFYMLNNPPTSQNGVWVLTVRDDIDDFSVPDNTCTAAHRATGFDAGIT